MMLTVASEISFKKQVVQLPAHNDILFTISLPTWKLTWKDAEKHWKRVLKDEISPDRSGRDFLSLTLYGPTFPFNPESRSPHPACSPPLYCPHTPEAGCAAELKPQPQLLCEYIEKSERQGVKAMRLETQSPRTSDLEIDGSRMKSCIASWRSRMIIRLGNRNELDVARTAPIPRRLVAPPGYRNGNQARITV